VAVAAPSSSSSEAVAPSPENEPASGDDGVGPADLASTESGGGGKRPPLPSSPPPAAAAADYESGTNWVHGGGIEANPYLFVLLVLSPFVSLLLAYVTSAEMGGAGASASAPPFRITHPLTEMVPYCLSDATRCASSVLRAGSSVLPNVAGAKMVLSFMGLALVLERSLPGRIEHGPETATGHVPAYVANGVAHCAAFSLLFLLGSDLGPCGGGGGWWSADHSGLCGVVRYEPYSFGVLYDLFPPGLAFLNLFGIVFCIFLTLKGMYHPSTSDNGSSGSWVKDYLWGTELYPRVFGLDLKRFVNCRFSMTFWQLAGLSYCYRSYVLHGNTMDWGLFFSALSQYLYLVKFFVWVSWFWFFWLSFFSRSSRDCFPGAFGCVPRLGTPPPSPTAVIIFALTILSLPIIDRIVRSNQEMGYMRSIDIIVDRAGYEIQWGCLVWVPAVYSFHTRFLVQNPSGLSFPAALSLFALSMAGVVLNYAADRERDVFRASGGECLVWGSRPRYIVAKYTVVDGNTGKGTTKTSLLLASGFWGMARHFQYFFELTAAYSWCLLANPARNGVLVMFYALFLTLLLVDRAKRDTDKCRLKYGKYYDEYCDLVPYKIVPGIF